MCADAAAAASAAGGIVRYRVKKSDTHTMLGTKV